MEEKIVSAHAGDRDVAKIVVTHPVAGFQRGEVVPLDHRHEPRVSAPAISLQRSCHTDRVEALPAMRVGGESLVHVDVALAEVQLKAADVEVGRLRRVPAVGSEIISRYEAIAF